MNEYWPMDELYIEKIMRRKNVFMREFSVAGVSKHQNLIPKNGFLNDDFFLPDILLEEKGIHEHSIPKYGFENLDLSIEPDPDNEFDPNAIKVYLGGEHVGFIRTEDTEYIHEMMEADRIADVDGRIVGGPAKRYDPVSNKIKTVDQYFGIRLYVFIRNN